jgi:hypothetical protein
VIKLTWNLEFIALLLYQLDDTPCVAAGMCKVYL